MQIVLPITGILGSFVKLAKITASSRQGQVGARPRLGNRILAIRHQTLRGLLAIIAMKSVRIV